MAVEKVTIQQAAGDLLKDKGTESTADTYSFNGSNINPFEASISKLQKNGIINQPVQKKNKSKLLFGNNIIQEPEAKKEKINFEVPKAENKYNLNTLYNYFKNVKYGIEQFDAASAPYVKQALGHLPDKDSLYAAVDSNKRIAAILLEANLL